MNTRINRSDLIKKIAVCGMFAALAYVCVCVFRIKVMFLTLDIKDAITTVAAMLLGPIAGVTISLIVALIEMLTISETMFYGFIMNFLSSATLSVVASLIYRSKRSLFSAVLGLVTASVSVTAVMMLANLLITPFYMGVSSGEVAALIPKVLLPFNLTKAVLNCSITMIIYKPISTAMVRAGIIKKTHSGDGKSYGFSVKTVAVTLSALAVLAICLVIFFVVLNAEISFFNIKP